MLVNSQLKFLISRRGKNRTSFEKIQLLSDISSFLSLIRFQLISETRSLAYSLEPIENCADGVAFTSIYLDKQPFTRRSQRIFTRRQLPEKGLRHNLFPQQMAGLSHSWVSIREPRGGFCLQPDFIRRPSSAGRPSPTLHGRPISVGGFYIYNV